MCPAHFLFCNLYVAGVACTWHQIRSESLFPCGVKLCALFHCGYEGETEALSKLNFPSRSLSQREGKSVLSHKVRALQAKSVLETRGRSCCGKRRLCPRGKCWGAWRVRGDGFQVGCPAALSSPLDEFGQGIAGGCTALSLLPGSRITLLPPATGALLQGGMGCFSDINPPL